MLSSPCLTRAQDIWWHDRWHDRGHGRGAGVASSWRPSGVRLSWVRAWRIPPWLARRIAPWLARRIAPRLARVQRGVWTSGVGSRGLAWLYTTVGREAICRGRWVIPALWCVHRAMGVIVPWRVVWPGHFTCEEGSGRKYSSRLVPISVCTS